jgi:GNAT superfamily N-acetyltransferase
VTLTLRALDVDDRAWVAERTEALFGGPTVVVDGREYRPDTLPGLAAVDGERRVGLVTWRIDGDVLEVVTLDAGERGRGNGSLLLRGAEDAARRAGSARVRVVTTNDNRDALRFYQNRGFSISEVRRGAVERSRRLKPEIPRTGESGVGITDEIELAKPVSTP